MRYYDPFVLTGESFTARVGPPDPVSAAVGRLALQFATLEATLAATLIRLLEGDEQWHALLTTGLSFEAKLQLLEERVRLLAPTRVFHTGDIEPLELFAELRTQCLQAAQLWAQVLDPATAEAILTRTVGWRDRGARRARRRAARTDEANPGAAHPPTGQLGPDRLTDPSVLLDVADFVCMVTEDFRKFFG
jgi:hypothetical protein